MRNKIEKILKEIEVDMIRFTQELVKIKSFTQEESEIAMCVKQKMIDLGYDDVIQDPMGNIIGVIGSGETKIMYDSHLDTVQEGDVSKWTMNPFGGDIKDDKIYGRGTVDMKSAIAASVYAGYAIKELGLDKDKTIYVSASVMEEDFDGEALMYILKSQNIAPDMTVICEPSSLQIATGHRGRALIKVTTEGVSAHGSAPDKGLNAIYKMTTITERIKALQEVFQTSKKEFGTIAVTKIESEAVSLNAIPSACSIYIDRRLVIGEDEPFIEEEMNMLLKDTQATWEVYDEVGQSWTGQPVVLRSFLPAWEIDLDHPLVKGASYSHETIHEQKTNLIKWDFCTNGVASAGVFGIPTIGYGPGNPKMAHKVDEYCELEDIKNAFKFYTLLPHTV